MILKADRSLFGRIIIIGLNRKSTSENCSSTALGHCHGLKPLQKGSLSRRTKQCWRTPSKMMCSELMASLPRTSATIIDGMSLVQKLNIGGEQTTFGMVASSLLTKVLHKVSESDRIDVVFDTYRDMLIKNAEGTIRGEVAGVQLSHISATQLVNSGECSCQK